MDLVQYIRGIRRRWKIVLGAAILAAAVAWVTTTSAPLGPNQGRVYQASALLDDTSSSVGGRTDASVTTDPNTLVVYVTLRENAEAVAKKIGFDGDPLALAQQVTASVANNTNILTISATDTDPKLAEQIANGFSDQLVTYLTNLRKAGLEPKIDILEEQLKQAQHQAKKNQGSNARPGTADPTVITLQSQLDTLRGELVAPIGWAVIERAVAQPTSSAGIKPPDTRAGRVGLATIIGLLAGIVLALVLERFDTKIRTKANAEEWFGLPVLAEVPKMPRSDRKGVTSARRPTSPVADAFRLLGAGITRAMSEAAPRPPSSDGRGTVILVTSAGPSEGKTTVVANLAAIYAEIGRSVLVLSCDLRRPSIHRLLGVEDTHGLAEALVSQNGRAVLEGKVLLTLLENVSLLPAGGAAKAGLLGSDHMRKVLTESRALADVVIMDTAPILVASEVAPLVAEVDAVVVVAEAGKISGELAGRTSELLARLGATVAGVALNRAAEVTIPRGYYRYYTAQPTPPQNGSVAEGSGSVGAATSPGVGADSDRTE